MGDIGCPPIPSHKQATRSYQSLNAGRLKSVQESSESIFHAKYSIPPYSPRNSMIAQSPKDYISIVGSADQEQESGCEKSSVESLLDRHMECLGLQTGTRAEPIEEHKELGNDATQASTISTSKEESTVQFNSKRSPQYRLRAEAISLAAASNASSTERHRLMSQGLFSPDALKEPLLAAPQPSPCVSDPSFQKSSGRPSSGWNTLTSISNLSSENQTLSTGVVRSFWPNDSSVLPDIEIQQVSTTPLSPSVSSCWSDDSEDLYNWNEDALTRQRSRQRLLERQISQRRKTRMRLKLKRNSQSQAKICASGLSSAHESFHAAKVPSPDRVSVLKKSSQQNAVVTESHDTAKMENGSVRTAQSIPAPLAPKSHKPSALPDIPNRRTSVVAIAAQKMKQGVDMARKMSVGTMRSRYSNASMVEPLNSTRLSAMAPHLAAPDLGPPLTSISLNVNFAFPQAAVTAPPGLRATQSFFSDDSSRVRNPRASLRKRFNLPSLRSVLPSPSSSFVCPDPGRNGEAAHPKLYQSCQTYGLRQEDDECDLNGTVGMSEFAYCRRRMLERVKGWWKRHTVQTKFGLKRRMGGGILCQNNEHEEPTRRTFTFWDLLPSPLGHRACLQARTSCTILWYFSQLFYSNVVAVKLPFLSKWSLWVRRA